MRLQFPSWIREQVDWDRDVVYLLDAELRFVECNPAWNTFAAENGGIRISADEVKGRCVLDYVPDVLRAFYVHRYWLAQRSSQWAGFDYHCSSPEKIRLFQMKLCEAEGGVLVMNHLLLEEACAPVDPLDDAGVRQYVTPHGSLVLCANCRKARRRDSGEWDWVPAFLCEHGFTVSHGLCPRCTTHLYG